MTLYEIFYGIPTNTLGDIFDVKKPIYQQRRSFSSLRMMGCLCGKWAIKAYPTGLSWLKGFYSNLAILY